MFESLRKLGEYIITIRAVPEMYAPQKFAGFLNEPPCAGLVATGNDIDSRTLWHAIVYSPASATYDVKQFFSLPPTFASLILGIDLCAA